MKTIRRLIAWAFFLGFPVGTCPVAGVASWRTGEA